MDHDFYKGHNIIKVDLCSFCQARILDALMIMTKTSEKEIIKPILDERYKYHRHRWNIS